MNSILMKVGVAYIAGIVTILVFQNVRQTAHINTIEDTIAKGAAPAGSDCACDNTNRYNLTASASDNIPLTTEDACRAMVSQITDKPKGAWFSKITLDLMFCHAPAANGVFVYRARTAEKKEVMVIEAARQPMISTTDDGSSYIYYSTSLCPMICGHCGM